MLDFYYYFYVKQFHIISYKKALYKEDNFQYSYILCDVVVNLETHVPQDGFVHSFSSQVRTNVTPDIELGDVIVKVNKRAFVLTELTVYERKKHNQL